MAFNKNEYDRIREAYLNMANEAQYRPQLSNDLIGDMTEEELSDAGRLEEEAAAYAMEFIRQEDSPDKFHIGISNFRTNRALVYTIEAARLLCGGRDATAMKLLEMAHADAAEGKKEYESLMRGIPG